MNGVGTYALVCGRWDAELVVVDLDLALRPENANTDRAVVNRIRVAEDPDACALPVSVVVCPVRKRAYVVNHGGCATCAEAELMPHGHRGTLAVIDLEKAVGGAADALLSVIDLSIHGPVGVALSPDGTVFVTSGEGEGTEDGGFQILSINPDTCEVMSATALRHDEAPCPHASPHPGFGTYPNPNGIVAATTSTAVFTANGGTNDVSILRREPGRLVETGRLPLRSGGFGLALSKDERWLAIAEREDAATGQHGAHVLLVDAEAAAANREGAAANRILVGTDDSAQGSRPAGVAFAPDGAALFVTCAASGLVSRIEVADGGGKETFRSPVPSPRGIAVTPDGRHVAVAGGRRGSSSSGTLWLLDSERLDLAANVSGVGNEPYFLTITKA